MSEKDSREIAGDLSSQQILVSQLKQRLQLNESLLKGRETEFAELQTKFSKLKFIHKSKTSTSGGSEATPMTPKTGSTEDKSSTSSSAEMSESVNRGKFLLLKKQLEESRALINRHENEKKQMKKEIQVLREKQMKYEEEEYDRDVEIISPNEPTSDYSTRGENVNELFAQIVYKDTKIMEMNQRICDLEANIMDLQENLKEQNEVLQARNRAIKVLLSQQQTGGALNLSFDEVVQREEEKERIEKLKERVTELEVEKGNLQLKLMEIEGTNGSKPPLIDIELERDSLRAERDELKIKYTEIIAKFDSLEMQKEKVISDKEKLLHEIKRFKELTNNYDKEKDKMKTNIEELKAIIAVNEKKHHLVANEVNKLNAEKSEKETEIENVRQQLSELARKSKSVISEKDALICDLRLELDQKSDNILHEKDEMIQEVKTELEKYKNENWTLANVNQQIKSINSELEEKVRCIQIELDSQISRLEEVTADKENSESDKQGLLEKLNNDIKVLENDNLELKSQLEKSSSHVSQFELQLNESLEKYRIENSQLLEMIQKLKDKNSELETNSSERVEKLEEVIKTQMDQLSALENEKAFLNEEREILNNCIEAEKQRKHDAIEMMEKIQNEKYAENDLIVDKDKQIEQLRSDLEEYESLVNNQKLEISDFNKKQSESLSLIKDLELDLEEKVKAFEELQSNYSQNQLLTKEKLSVLDEMDLEKKQLESRLEEAKLKNQSLADQMESLITVAERENSEKERLKEYIDRLQNEKFEESDFLKNKDSRIESLQQELRKQVEDMQEIEELLTEKQNEIEILNNDIILLQNDKQSLNHHNEELLRKVKAFDSDRSEEMSALMKEIEDLNEENDSHKNEIQILNKRLSDELIGAEERLRIKEEENHLIVEELRKQLESQEMKLNEAMNELMIKSDENTDTNLLLNEIQTLRETLVSLQTENDSSKQNHQQLISQLHSSVDEYKALLDEARSQIDRLEAEKLIAIQETNKVNQVLETERDNQSIVITENHNLKQQITQIESQLELMRSQNLFEYESAQSERINQLNQIIDDLQKQNFDLTSNLEHMKQYSNEVQSSCAKQLEEMQTNVNNDKLELNQRLNEVQNRVESLRADKEGFESAYYDLQNRYQQIEGMLQNKDIEINHLRESETTVQKLSQSLSNLNEEKEHLLRVLSEKESALETDRREKLNLLREVQEKQYYEQLLREKEDQLLEMNSKMNSLNEMNGKLQKSSEELAEKELTFNARISELEKCVEIGNEQRNEDESKISELEYELDILKRNYNLEIDSFGSSALERETLIEKMQNKLEEHKKKLEIAEKTINEHLEKEHYFKTKLDESQGLVKYEQMQRQSATDSRVLDLQQRLEECENSYQLEIMNLKADNSNLIALESDLRRKVEELQKSQNFDKSSLDFEREINNYRSHVESLVNQLEAERIEKRQSQDLYEANITEKTFQLNNLLAQIEAERQTQLAQKSELELKCKKFAAKFKVKEREANSLEEKLRIAKENASKNVNEEDLINSNKMVEELQKKVEDLQFTATNLDSALQSERDRRRQLENDRQAFWSQSPKGSNLGTLEGDPENTSSSFSLFIDDENGDKSKLSSAKRFISKQRHFFSKGPPNARYKRILVIAYLLILHLLFIKMCLF